MSSYLKTIYKRTEYGEEDYPQKLCNHLVERYISKHIDIKGKTLLDIGSGKGAHLNAFARRGFTCYGLDKLDECVEALDNFDIRSCNIESEPFPYDDNTFDVVYSKSVIEHVCNTDNFVKETLRVLKPGGVAVIMTPDWKSNQRWFWDDYTHVKPFTRKALQNAFIINGFSSVDCSIFIQLPILWKHPWLRFFTRLIAMVTPDAWRWVDKEESQHNKLVRFCKEEMLICTGVKPHE